MKGGCHERAPVSLWYQLRISLIIKKLFSATLNCHPSGTVTYRDRITYTYGAFRERVVRLAGALAALG